MSIFYINGEYLSEDEAYLPVRDLSILRGYGVFDYLRTYGGHLFRLQKNIARLRRSCEILELDLRWSDEELCEIAMETLARNKNDSDNEYGIRFLVTGGISQNNITPDGKATLMILAEPFTEPFNFFPREYYEKGVKIIRSDVQRIFPNAKSTLYTSAIIAQKRAREQGAVEALYMDNDNVLEGTTSNIFAFYGNSVITPPTQDTILPGITRMTVLELMRSHFEVIERDLPYDELIAADEVLLTSATKEIMPVIKVDEHTIGDGTVGEGTQQVMALFKELTERRAQGIEI
jgi:branched-chain amino acid aminotransferase